MTDLTNKSLDRKFREYVARDKSRDKARYKSRDKSRDKARDKSRDKSRNKITVGTRTPTLKSF